MSNYHRYKIQGGYYFFTLVAYNRKKIFVEPDKVQRIKNAFKHVKVKYPFSNIAYVILPDHLHCLWHLPEGDDNFSIRWHRIKHYFSIGVKANINSRNEKQIWQRRFWEHYIRDQEDFKNHFDYIHYNPVKHGLVDNPQHWEHSSLSHYVQKGYYKSDWTLPDNEWEIHNLE